MMENRKFCMVIKIHLKRFENEENCLTKTNIGDIFMS
jgi:hypothetical protein